MRQLFVPACLCLMTFSGSTAPDSKFSLEQFSGRPAVNKRAPASVAPVEASSLAETPAPSTDGNPSAPDDVSVAVAIPSDRPIDIPAQTEIEPVLEPQPIPLPPIPKPIVHRSRQEVCDTLTKAAESNDLPIPFFIRLLFQESGFKPDVVSRAGAQGVAQFMPETAASVGLDNPFDPMQAIPASARLLRSLAQQFGNLGLAAAAYNAGPRRIQEWLANKGKLPQETQGYVKIITGRPAESWKAAATGTPEIRLQRRAPCQELAGLHAWNGPDRIPVPVPSPLTRVAEVPLRGTIRVAAKGAIQMAARKAAPDKAKHRGRAVRVAPAAKPAIKLVAKAATKTTAKSAAKPLRVAVATHGTRK